MQITVIVDHMAKRKKSPPPVIKVTIVLDRSGSMESIRSSTVSGVNEYYNTLRSNKDNSYLISLYQFDSDFANNAELTVTYENVPLKEVTELTTEHYQPRGGTPLYDAIGECIRRTTESVDESIKGNIFVVITDGQNNTSKEFNITTIKQLIKQKESEGWTVVFLGADINSYEVGGSIGLSTSNTSNFNKSNTGAMYKNLGSSTLRRSMAYNMSSNNLEVASMGFFEETEKQAMGDVTVSNPVMTHYNDPLNGIQTVTGFTQRPINVGGANPVGNNFPATIKLAGKLSTELPDKSGQ